MIQIKGWLRCPVCGIAINKVNGCQYVVCTSSKCRGRTYLCYECGQKMDFIHQRHECKIREELVRAIGQNDKHDRDDGNIYLGGLLHIRRDVRSPPPPPRNQILYIKPRKNYPWGKSPLQRKREPKPNLHGILPLMVEGKKLLKDKS
ncbi:unnamed protein product [Blepharisma stoltei]|uniref:Uncharacterized protein n=1 Tax=Blepharisma stoltei TaxID=1481888 RepID=A0AAU9JIL1_9CILI|nr:unnamed protein product [Blepharisma stoltei]